MNKQQHYNKQEDLDPNIQQQLQQYVTNIDEEDDEYEQDEEEEEVQEEDAMEHPQIMIDAKYKMPTAQD